MRQILLVRINTLVNTLMPVYEKLFNSILNKGPCRRLGVVVLLLPFINRADEAIRQTTGVSVSSCLGKLFCSILNQRLLKYIVSLNILHKS